MTSAKERLSNVAGQLSAKTMSTAQQELEAALAQGVKDGKIPNAVVYATNADGSFQYSFSTGYSNPPTNTKPISDDAVFMLASQTKLLTSISALQAIEQGVLTLDEDITSHIPEISNNGILTGFSDSDKPIITERKQPITLRHLLTHSSGAGYMLHPNTLKHQAQRGLGGEKQSYAGTITERYDTALLFEPGSSWMYSPGLDWIGLLLKRLTGEDLETRFQKYILSPLNISGITFWPAKSPSLQDKIPSLVQRAKEGGLEPNNEVTLNTNSTEPFGGHGAYAQIPSYLQVMKSLLANDGKLLKPEIVNAMFSPQLGSDSATALNYFISNFQSMIPGQFPPNINLQYGLGGAIQLEDWAEVGRKRGTLFWSGFYNPVWYIDREADLAWTMGTNMLPAGDAGAKEMSGMVERGLYKMLQERK